jgi:hypothetical protein
MLSTPPPAPAAPAAELAPFDPLERSEWRWTQPRRSRSRWELFAGDRRVATLESERGWSRAMIARFAGETLILHASLFRNVSVERVGDPAPRVRYVPHWLRGGRIETADEALKFRMTGFLSGVFEIRTPEDLPLVGFRSRRSFLRQDCTISIEDAARRRRDLPLLLALGWDLALLSQTRSG